MNSETRQWLGMTFYLETSFSIVSIRSTPRGSNCFHRRPFSRNWVVTQKCASADNPYSRQNRDSIIVVLITLVTNALRLFRGKIFCQLYNPLESTHTSWPEGNSLYSSCQSASRSIIKAKTHYSTTQLASGNRDKTAVLWASIKQFGTFRQAFLHTIQKRATNEPHHRHNAETAWDRDGYILSTS